MTVLFNASVLLDWILEPIKVFPLWLLDELIESSFKEASQLLKTEKNKLVTELKTVGKETGGDKMKKLKILGKLLNILGIKEPASF